MNLALLRFANFSISVVLPIRRRPRHVTSEGTRLPHRVSRRSMISSRPKKDKLLCFAITQCRIAKSHAEGNMKNGTLSCFLKQCAIEVEPKILARYYCLLNNVPLQRYLHVLGGGSRRGRRGWMASGRRLKGRRRRRRRRCGSSRWWCRRGVRLARRARPTGRWRFA